MDELITLRREANADEGLRDCSLYEALVAYVQNHPDFTRGTRFLSDLARYRRMAEGRPVDALIWQLYRETGILSIAGADKEGDPAARRANLILLYDYARRFEASSYRGLYNFIAYINEAIERGQTIEEVRAQSERPDTVRVMTMHQSKGLEFPVTFVCDCGHGFNLKDAHAPVLFDREGGLSLKLRDDSGYARLRNPIYNLLSDRTVERAVEEELRILYVALTRAKERLYVTATVGNSDALTKKITSADSTPSESASYASRSNIELILRAVGKESFYDLTIDGEAPTDENTEASEAQAPVSEIAPALVAAYSETLKARFDFVYPDAHLSRLPGKMSVSRLYPTALDEAEEDAATLPLPAEEEDAPKTRTVPLFLGGERDSAARAGTATHLFMQFCDFAAAKEKGAAAELSRLVEKQFIAKEDAALVRLPEVEAFLQSSLFEMLCAPDARLYRELRFHARFPAAAFTADGEKKALYEGQTVLVQGVMDAVLITPSGELWLVDYKTDRLSAAEKRNRALAEEKLRTRHALQLSYYAAACRDIFGRTPDRTLIYSLALGDTVELPLSLPDGV
jgi:ATP-dependent helicase/nuclease subunit A